MTINLRNQLGNQLGDQLIRMHHEVLDLNARLIIQIEDLKDE